MYSLPHAPFAKQLMEKNQVANLTVRCLILKHTKENCKNLYEKTFSTLTTKYFFYFYRYIFIFKTIYITILNTLMSMLLIGPKEWINL